MREDIKFALKNLPRIIGRVSVVIVFSELVRSSDIKSLSSANEFFVAFAMIYLVYVIIVLTFNDLGLNPKVRKYK